MPSGTFTNHPTLVVALPPLVRKQRTLAGKIAVVAQAVKDEKLTREQIHALLIAAGLKKGDVVTCAGYDVRLNEKDGQESLSGELLTGLLTAAGLDLDFVAGVLKDATETGKAASFATVTPSKGAKVRA